METQKPQTMAQGIFGNAFGNRQIITKRPESMPFPVYRKALKEQNKLIKRVLR